MAGREESSAGSYLLAVGDSTSRACDVLERVAETLRAEIGPAVSEPFARTQAFMAAVVVEKTARELRLQASRAQADREEALTLVADLEALLAGASSPALRAALARARDGSAATLGRLVEALHAARGELGGDRFATALARMRRSMRARLDRQLEYAK